MALNPATAIQTLPESLTVAVPLLPPVSVEAEFVLEKEGLVKLLESYVEEDDKE